MVKISKLKACALASSLSLISINAQADDRTHAITPPDASLRLGAIAFTMATNTIIAGTASALDGESFWQGAKYGLLGGGLQAFGNEMAMWDVKGFTGIGFRIAEYGISITQGAIEGMKKPYAWHAFSVGPLLVNLNYDNEPISLTYRLTPFVGIFTTMQRGDKFDLGDSILNQTLSFHHTIDGKTSASSWQAGSTCGNIVTYAIDIDSKFGPTSDINPIRSHEIDHAIWFEQGRIAQSLLRKIAPWPILPLEKNFRYSVGEDAAWQLMSFPVLMCQATGEKSCGAQYGGLRELRAYTNQTGYINKK